MELNLRRVHIDGIEWKYIINSKELHIYEPGTKRIKMRVIKHSLPVIYRDRYMNSHFSSRHVRQFIKNNLIEMKQESFFISIKRIYICQNLFN